MRPEMRHPFELKFSVRVLHNICLSVPNLCPLVCSCFTVFLFLLSPVFYLLYDALWLFCFHTSNVYLELPQTEVLLRSFLCFYACVCIQLLSSADCNPSEPSLCECMFVLVHFFPVWKMLDCMFMCVCMRDVQRNVLWYRESFRNAISSLSVYARIHVGFIRIWKCCAAVPGLASPSSVAAPSLSPFVRSLASAVSLAGSCIRDEGLERRGRPAAYTRKLAIINRINMPRISDTFKSVCLCVCVWVGGRGCSS